jgi:hypothetical protein
MPDPVTALVVGGTQVVGGMMQADAAGGAADIQAGAANAGTAEIRRQFDALQALLKPYMEAGVPALNAQQDLLGLRGENAQGAAIGALEGSPLFQGLVQQGENAMLQTASATGGLRGGNLQGAMAQFRPAMLQQAINDQYSRLGGLTQLGQNSAAGVGSAGMQSAGQISGLLQQAGAAQAGGRLAQGQAMAGLFNMPAQFLGMQAGAGGKMGMGFGGLF